MNPETLGLIFQMQMDYARRAYEAETEVNELRREFSNLQKTNDNLITEHENLRTIYNDLLAEKNA